MFKDIPFTSGAYSCDENGNIKSNYRVIQRRNGCKQTIKERILKFKTNNQGYYYVTLCIDKKIKDYLVHRLVAITWLDNKNNLPQVNHIDRNPKNNHVDNLEWCTQSQNNHHIYSDGRDVHNAKSVLMKDADGNIIQEFSSMGKASIFLKGDRSKRAIISRACKRHGRLYGYYWEYKVS